MVSEKNSMATINAPTEPTQVNAPAKRAQLRLTRRSPAYWRVRIDNSPAARIAKFDKWAIAQTKRLVDTSLPPDVELDAGWMRASHRSGDPHHKMESRR
jgi:hypothetical protein